jgi:hypothetical protein
MIITEATHPNLFPSAERVKLMSETFDKVKNKADWKAPIKVEIQAEDVLLVVQSIAWFTATDCKISMLGYNSFDKTVIIESIGYRTGPAGDH